MQADRVSATTVVRRHCDGCCGRGHAAPSFRIDERLIGEPDHDGVHAPAVGFRHGDLQARRLPVGPPGVLDRRDTVADRGDDVVEHHGSGDDEHRADLGVECVADRSVGDRLAVQVGPQLVGRPGEPAAAAGCEEHQQRVVGDGRHVTSMQVLTDS